MLVNPPRHVGKGQILSPAPVVCPLLSTSPGRGSAANTEAPSAGSSPGNSEAVRLVGLSECEGTGGS